MNLNNLLDTDLKIVGSRHKLLITLLFRKAYMFKKSSRGQIFKTHLDFQIICIGKSIHLTQGEPEQNVSRVSFIWVDAQSIKSIIDLHVKWFYSLCNNLLTFDRDLCGIAAQQTDKLNG